MFLFPQAFQGSQPSGLVPEENLRMDLETEALVDAENNINTTPRLVLKCSQSSTAFERLDFRAFEKVVKSLYFPKKICNAGIFDAELCNIK